MKNFKTLPLNIPVQPLLDEIASHPELWNQHTFRTELPAGPFADCSDIILQYNDVDIYPAQELETVLYPAGITLKATYQVAKTLMYALGSTRLGRVMVTKLPPGGHIQAHTDSEVFTKYFDRFHISLQDNGKTGFRCGDEVLTPTPGQVFWFNNALEHEIVNDGDCDRLTMIVDLKKILMKKFYGKEETGTKPIEKIDLGVSKINPDVTYAVEPLYKLIPELKSEIIQHHYDEIALNQDVVPLDPDWDAFLAKERMGQLFIATMRHQRTLIGYYVATIAGHLHYKSTLHCAVDIYFVRKEHRYAGLGGEFFDTIETELRKRGVIKIIQGCKKHKNHSAMFEAMGYTQSDYTFVKIL